MIDLRFGDWRETMHDVDVDVVLTDPPYSSRTHDGQMQERSDGGALTVLDYNSIDEAYCRAFVESWRSGTTLLAARVEGRHCIASERDRDTYALAGLRLAQPFERDLFTREAS